MDHDDELFRAGAGAREHPRDSCGVHASCPGGLLLAADATDVLRTGAEARVLRVAAVAVVLRLPLSGHRRPARPRAVEIAAAGLPDATIARRPIRTGCERR